MDATTTIIGSQCYLYSNSLHVNFHDTIDRLLEEERPFLVGMAGFPGSLLDDYTGVQEQISDRLKQSPTSRHTYGLQADNAERNRLLSRIFFMVANMKLSQDENEASAAQSISALLSPYRRIQKQAGDAKTALIKGLLLDLRKPEHQEEVECLCLTPTMDALEQKNRDYERNKGLRMEERSKIRLADNMQTLRKKADSLYHSIMRRISALALLAPEGEERTRLEALIANINRQIRLHKTSYHLSRGQREAAKREREEKEQPTE